MLSVSLPQHRWLEMVRHDPAALARTGLTQQKADEWSHADRGSPWKHAGGGGITGYDDGGNIAPSAISTSGGITGDPTQTSSGVGGAPPSQQTANPLYQGMIQRYAGLPTEKLQELVGVMGGSPQGSLIRSLLTKRLTQPGNQQAPAMPPQTQPMPAQARGGPIKRRDIGGGVSLSEGDPYWSRAEQRQEGAGVLNGATFGRADTIKTQAPGGAYVLPADVVSGLGEGNTLAGARVIDEMMKTGPGGIPLQRMSRGPGLPRPPAPAQVARGGMLRAGGVNAAPKKPTPVMLSDGEHVITPEQIVAKFGDLKTGHRALDAFVVHQRKKHIEKLKSLPGPVVSK